MSANGAKVKRKNQGQKHTQWYRERNGLRLGKNFLNRIMERRKIFLHDHNYPVFQRTPDAAGAILFWMSRARLKVRNKNQKGRRR